MEKSFEGLTVQHLAKFNLVIGSDICFWPGMVSPLEALLRRALDSGVQMALIADPGRSTFEELALSAHHNGLGETLNWKSRHPYDITGRILKVGAMESL